MLTMPYFHPFSSLRMPAINSGSKVLVSGANGYIAIWIVRILLERGYAVRGIVRSAEKGAHLTNIFKDYGEKLDMVVVADITKVYKLSLYRQA